MLHHVDGLRQQARGRGLDDTPRTQAQYGALEEDGHFTTVTVEATRSEVRLPELRLGLPALAGQPGAGRRARAAFWRAVASSTTLRRRTAAGVTSTHSSSRRNSSAWSSDSVRVRDEADELVGGRRSGCWSAASRARR